MLNGWILPIGGVASERVCAFSRLVTPYSPLQTNTPHRWRCGTVHTGDCTDRLLPGTQATGRPPPPSLAYPPSKHTILYRETPPHYTGVSHHLLSLPATGSSTLFHHPPPSTTEYNGPCTLIIPQFDTAHCLLLQCSLHPRHPLPSCNHPAPPLPCVCLPGQAVSCHQSWACVREGLAWPGCRDVLAS